MEKNGLMNSSRQKKSAYHEATAFMAMGYEFLGMLLFTGGLGYLIEVFWLERSPGLILALFMSAGVAIALYSVLRRALRMVAPQEKTELQSDQKTPETESEKIARLERDWKKTESRYNEIPDYSKGHQRKKVDDKGNRENDGLRFNDREDKNQSGES